MWQQLLVVLLLWPLFQITLNDYGVENQYRAERTAGIRKIPFTSGFT